MPSKGFPALLQFRCLDEMRDQVALAAAQCEMTPGEWQRAITQGALELHFASLGEGEAIPDDLEVPEPAVDPEEYTEQVLADAAVLRGQEAQPIAAGQVVHPGLHDEPAAVQERPNPRDCPHPPRQRAGGRCTRCGLQVGQGLRGGLASGRFR